MRYTSIEIYNFLRRRYQLFEGLIDTGASVCAIAKHIARQLGLQLLKERRHLWQVRDPLVLNTTLMNIRYENREYLEVVAAVIDIPEEFQRDALPSEECTRPLRANPLSAAIILGDSFFNKLTNGEKKKLGIM